MNIRISQECFNEVYLPFIQDMEHRYFILCGGAGSGKSVAVAQKLVLRACNEAGIRILVMRETKNSQKESCFKLITKILIDWKIYPYCNINKTDLTITFPNRSEIIFLGCDDPERIKSMVDPAVIWFEEASQFTEEEYDSLVLRVRAPKYKNQVILSLNPTSKLSFVYKRWFSSSFFSNADTYILKTTYKDNKFLTKDYIDSLEHLISSNPTYYKIYALGEWTSLDRLVLNNWTVQPVNVMDVNGTHCVGLDFGYVNDPSALVESTVDTDKKVIYVSRIWGKTGQTNSELASVIKALGLAKSIIIADSAEQKSIDEIRRAGIPHIRKSIKGPDSVLYGIQKLQQYKIIVDPSCEELITELENYTWQKDTKTGEYLQKPIDAFNHYIDALRYSLQIIDKYTVYSFDKKLLGV